MNPFQLLHDMVMSCGATTKNLPDTMRNRIQMILSLLPRFPHHEHIPPDIKHHRIPAPNMSFTRPNPSVLIQEVEELIRQEKETDTPS